MSSSSSPKPAPANLEAAKAASVSKSSCAESAFVDWSSRMADMVDMDGGKHFPVLDDLLDDLHLRLEELEHLSELSGRDSSSCLFGRMPEMAERYKRMEEVFAAVDRIELMAAKAKADMDDMERRLSEAEATLSPSTSSGSASAAILSAAGEGASSLRSFVKPLLFGSRASSGADGGPSSPPGKPPVKTFSADDFFPPSQGKDGNLRCDEKGAEN